MIDRFDDEEDVMPMHDGEYEPTPGGLAQWFEAQFHGDERFDEVEVAEPGPLDGEAIRIRFVCDDKTHFFAAIHEDDEFVRVGLCTGDCWLSESIESESSESGDSLTEVLQDLMEADEDLEYEVQHFHEEGLFYFCSDIPYSSEMQLASDEYHDLLAFYLDGYIMSYIDKIEEQ